MSKNFNLLVALFIALVACSTLALGNSVEMKFVNDFIATNTHSIIEFNFKGISASTLNGQNWLVPKKNPADTSTKYDTYQINNANNLRTNPVEALGYRGDMCWEPTTGQIVAQASLQNNSGPRYVLSFSNWFKKQFDDDKINSWTMRCAIGITADPTPNVFEWEINIDNGAVGFSTLAWPSRGVVEPVINFKTASVKQESEDPFSSAEVNIEFTTSQIGPHVVFLENGPRPYAVNLESGIQADFFCTAGKDKEFARILYGSEYNDNNVELKVQVSTQDPSVIIVNVSSPTTEVIKCKLSYTNYFANNYVTMEKQVARISLGASQVQRSLQLKTVRAGTSGYLYYDSNSATVEISTSPLAMTAAEPRVNSTMEFVFSPEINLQSIQLRENTGDETSYRQNYNCYGYNWRNNQEYYYATSYVDAVANKLTLKDIEIPSNLKDSRIYCQFDFAGSKSVSYHTMPQFAWVQVSVDGSQLAALAGTDTKIPLWVETVGYFNRLQHDEAEKDGVITIVDTFKIEQESIYLVMHDPRMVLSISGINALTLENYKDHLRCQITSPTVSDFKDLTLKFDDKRLVWEAELTDLKMLEGYSLTVKCTRSVNKVMLYGYDMTPTNTLFVELIDLIGGKTHYSYDSMGMGMSPREQTPTQTSAFPTQDTVQMAKYTAEFVLPIHFDVKTISEELRQNFASWILAAKMDDNKQYWDISSIGPTFVSFDYQSNKSYRNMYSIDDFFDYMVSLQKDGSLGLDFDYLDSFSNIQNSNLHLSWSDSISVYVSVHLKFVQKDQAAPIPSLQWKGDEGFYSAIYGQSIVPQMSTDISSSGLTYGNSVVPATGCGYTAGLNIFSSKSPKYNYAASSDPGDDKWNDLKTWFSSSINNGNFHLRCNVGDACSTNADCDGSLQCGAGVCKQMDLYLPKYLDLSDTWDNPLGSALERKYASNATIGSFVAIVVVAVLAILF